MDSNDINKRMPKIPGMRWAAVLNYVPTNQEVQEMNRMFPDNGKWHSVIQEKDQVHVDGKRIWKKDRSKWT